MSSALPQLTTTAAGGGASLRAARVRGGRPTRVGNAATLLSGSAASATTSGNSASAALAHGNVRGDVVAATFANMDLVAARSALETYYKKYQDLRGQYDVLREELERQGEDAVKVVAHYEHHVQTLMQDAAEYKAEVNRLLASHEEAAAALSTRYDAMLQSREEQIAEYEHLTARLNDDLRQASRYVYQRQEHTLELKRLQGQLQEMAEKHEKDIATLRFQTIDRKMKLVAMEEAMRNEFAAFVKAESTRLLEERYHALVEHNRSLQEERAHMAHDLQELMQLNDTIDAQRVQMRRTAELHQQAHAKVLRHTVLRERQTRETEARVQRLEAELKRLRQAQQTIRSTVAAQYEARVAALEKELRQTTSALQAHRVELRHMRQLATTVVTQRTELEKFFHVALEDCRRYRLGIMTDLSRHTTAGHYTIHNAPGAVGEHKAGETGMYDGDGSLNGSVPAAECFRLPQRTLADEEADNIIGSNNNYNGVVSSYAHKVDSVEGRHTPRMTTVPHGVPLEQTQGSSSSSNTCASAEKTGTNARLFLTEVHAASNAGRGQAENAAQASMHGTRPETIPPAVMSSEGVYFDDLPWADKEKVIKALLFYINSTYYKQVTVSAPEEELQAVGAAGNNNDNTPGIAA